MRTTILIAIAALAVATWIVGAVSGICDWKPHHRWRKRLFEAGEAPSVWSLAFTPREFARHLAVFLLLIGLAFIVEALG